MIKPFSGKNYYENSQKAGNLTPCVICGKGVNVTHKTHYVTVINGGSIFGPKDSDENDPGYMGGFPIGPDCWKRVKNELGELAT